MVTALYLPARDGLKNWTGELIHNGTLSIVDNQVLKLRRASNGTDDDRFAGYIPFDSIDGELYAVFNTLPLAGTDGLMGIFAMRWKDPSVRAGGPSGYTLSIIPDKSATSGYSLWLENGIRKLASYPLPYYKHTNDYCARFSVTGSIIKAKVWPSADGEPGWQIVLSDSSVQGGQDRKRNGVFTHNGGSVDYRFISFGFGSSPAPSMQDLTPASTASKQLDNTGFVAGPLGGFPAGGAYVPKKVIANYDIVGSTTTARITTNLPTLSHKYSLRGNKGFPWVAIEIKKIIYKEPGKLYISPSTEVARVKISQPALNYKAPPNTRVVGSTTTARITTNLPTITFSSKHAIIGDQSIVHIEIPQPTIIFKDVERYTFYADPVTARIRTTLPSIRFKRVQINPDVWSTPQQRIEQEWRKLPVSSEATGAWRQHEYVRSNDQVWRDRRREDSSQWRKPVSTTRDEQEWRRVVYD